jgi:GH24 family phage-related lysozyme (muramidase)
MPFKSEAQRAWMYANHPEMAKRWDKHTRKGKKLPRRTTKESVGLSQSVDSLFAPMVSEADLPWTKRAAMASTGMLLGLLAAKVMGGKESYQPPAQAKEPATATHQKPSQPVYPPPPTQAPPTVAEPFQRESLSLEEAKEFIHPNEGRRAKVYRDSVGKRTIGVGFNLDQPGAAKYLRDLGINYTAVKTGQRRLTDDEIDSLFEAKVQDALKAGPRVMKTFEEQPKEVQLAVTDLIYTLGPTGFANMDARDHLERFDYPRAANSLQRTTWRMQVGDRAERVIGLIRSAGSVAKRETLAESIDDIFGEF